MTNTDNTTQAQTSQYETFQVYKNSLGETFALKSKRACGERWDCYGGQVVSEDYLTMKCERVDK